MSAEKLSTEARLSKMLQFFRDGNSATAAALANQFGVSARTIRNDIKSLNNEFGDSGIIDGKNGEYA